MNAENDMFGGELPRVGAPLFVERWGNRKAFWIGVHAGRGLSAPAICKELGDGVTPNVLTGMMSAWDYKLPSTKRTHGPVKVMLSAKHRTMIHAEAKRRDMDMSELMRRVIVQVAQDRMWTAILDL